MRKITDAAIKTKRPLKVIQFGEGNFLRAFADWMIDIANERGVFNGGVTLLKPIPYGSLETLRSQDCLYTVLLRGKQDGKTVEEARIVTSVAGAVDCISEYEAYVGLAKDPDLRFVVSNTTEAGIVYDENDKLELTPPISYPGKLTKFLYERWQAFSGAGDKGLIILPVELIENNGKQLFSCCMRLCMLWGLSEGFRTWLAESNIFCQTLVDRIVTGYPKDEAASIEAKLGYGDKAMVTGEPFALWVIESDKPGQVQKEFPLDKAGLPVVFTDNLQPYRERKVRVLNGAHTSTVLAAYLAGLNTVGEMMADKDMRALLEKNIYGELLPYVPLPEDEVRAFADSVIERFENPFIKHNLLSIALNSVSKFKSRVLPTIRETYTRTGTLPDSLCFSLAALMAFYSGQYEGGKWVGKRGGVSYGILDDAPVLQFFADNAELSAGDLSYLLVKRLDFWGVDLSAMNGLTEKLAGQLTAIREKGVRAAAKEL